MLYLREGFLLCHIKSLHLFMLLVFLAAVSQHGHHDFVV
jgi:hypothetical protein